MEDLAPELGVGYHASKRTCVPPPKAVFRTPALGAGVYHPHNLDVGRVPGRRGRGGVEID